MRLYMSVPVAPGVRVRQDIGRRKRRRGGDSDPEGNAIALLLTIVVMAVIVTIAYWWIMLPLIGLALLVWGLAKHGDKLIAAEEAEKAALEEAKIPKLDAAGCCTVCGAPGEVHVSADGVVMPVEQWHAALAA
jgi:hypothetical protein